jgi:glucose/arabinose dehydrogenase
MKFLLSRQRSLQLTASKFCLGASRKTERWALLVSLLLVAGLSLVPVSKAATLPANFTESQLAGGLSNPTAMAFAPDGRLFVCQQGGQLRVVKNGALLAAPFVTLTG